MKALSGAVTASAVLVAGLVSAPPAAAAPYPHSIITSCGAVPRSNVVHVGQRPVAKFSVLVTGNFSPETVLTIKAIRDSSHHVMWTDVRRYRGHAKRVRLHRLPLGVYTVRFKTAFDDDSVFRDCRARFVLSVVR
jgi:hypothetical protein